jgi:uncharacterized protein
MGNIETVEKMYRLFAEGHTEAIKNIFDEHLSWNMMDGFPNGGRYKGIDAVYKNVFGYFKEYWTDWKAVNDRVVDIGDGVIVFGHYEGTYKSTGKYVRAPYASEYSIENGKIIAYNQYTDTFLIFKATCT